MTWTAIESAVPGTKLPALRYNAQVKANIEHGHGYDEQPYTNVSGGALAIGDLVAQASDTTVDVLAVVGSALPLLIATEAVANGAVGYFARTGFALVNVTGAIVAGDYLQSSLTTKKAQKATNEQGIFGRARSSSATQVIALLGEVGGGLADHNHTAVGDGGVMTNPHIITAVKDANGNTILGLSPVASSVNYPFLVNAATGGVVELGVAGSDTDVNLALLSQAHGVIKLLTNGLQRFMADGNGNVVVGSAAIGTTATDGFFYAPSSAGAPTGTPTAYTGRIPFEIDSSNERIYVRIGSNWRYVRVGATGDPDAIGSTGWALGGNTVGADKKLGTIDDYRLPIITNNIERAYFSGGAATNTAFEVWGSINRAPFVVYATNIDNAGQNIDQNVTNYEATGTHKTTMFRSRVVSAASYGADWYVGLNKGDGQDSSVTNWLGMQGSSGKIAVGDLTAGFPAYLAIRESVSGANVDALLENTNNASGTANAVAIAKVGGTSGGDAYSSYQIPSGTSWGVGVDNSDGDKFKIFRSDQTPGTNDAVAIDSSNNVAVDTSTLYVDAANNRVGVLTAAPESALDVRGQASVNSAGVYCYGVGSPAATDYETFRYFYYSPDGAYYFQTLAGGTGVQRPLRFYTGGNFFMAGNVGLGTAAPFFILDSVSDIRLQNGSKLYLGGSGASDNDTNLYRSAADTLKTDDSFHVGADLRHLGSNVGFFNHAAAGQQTSGADLTNNITSGGTTDTITNWTDLTLYANDAAAIRNAVYQLARKVKQLNDGVRALGLFT